MKRQSAPTQEPKLLEEKKRNIDTTLKEFKIGNFRLAICGDAPILVEHSTDGHEIALINYMDVLNLIAFLQEYAKIFKKD